MAGAGDIHCVIQASQASSSNLYAHARALSVSNQEDIEARLLGTDGEFYAVKDKGVSDLNLMIHQIVDARLREGVSLMIQEEERNRKDQLEIQDEDDHESNPLVWNINAMSLLCWKGWDWPHNQRWNEQTQRFEKVVNISGKNDSHLFQFLTETYFLRYFLCYFPIVLAFFEVVTLVGMTDQGSTLKRMIYGDGYYQSSLWRYSRTSASRDSFQPVLSANGSKVGFTANILKNRPANEAGRCLNDAYLMPIHTFQWTEDALQMESVLWPLVENVKPQADWLFSHCLPWEYASLCANLLKVNHFSAKKTLNITKWLPRQCTVPDPNAHSLMSIDDWEGLSASPDEIRKSHTEALVPKRLEDRLELVMWVVTRLVCDAKSLNFYDDSFSSFLYINVSYLYRLGVGEAYIVELMTITTLSFFLFYTSFLGEAQQLMHQVTLCSTLRCYEDALFAVNSTIKTAPSTQALLRKGGKKLARGRGAMIAHYIALVNSDLMCDLFLSLRIIFLAYMVMCTEMITTWDHGVLAVIFSVLAIAFLFEIDDKLMEVFVTMGWTESAFYNAKLRPMLHDFASEERRVIAAYRATKTTSTPRELVASWWSRGMKQPTVWGLSIVRFWAFLLITALFTVHQYLVFQIATNTGTQADIVKVYDSIFYEWGSAQIGGGYQIAKLSAGIYLAVCLNTICYRGISSLGNLVQLGLCLIWTYALFRETVINGILVWYADLRPDQTVEEHFTSYLLHESSLLFFPPLCLHVLGCIFRPMAFYLRLQHAEKKSKGTAHHELVSSDAHPIEISCAMEEGSNGTYTVS